MSPIAIMNGGGSPTTKDAIPRRPSPWTDLAHSLSETSLHPSARRSSISNPQSATSPTSAISTPLSPSEPSPRLSSSALREWDRLLLESSGQARRHHLIHPATLPSATPPVPALRHAASTGSLSAPKLAAERDKEGHIEYKLKLIDPSPDRFERLVTQMLWRLKQGRNEAIYEIGLADDGTVIGLTRAEMDASLSTLEQMAAEIGATVLILKEIVLTGATTLHRHTGLSPWSSSISSSVLSLSSGCSGEASGLGTWMVRRPDLDESGQPRRGSRTVSSGSAPVPSVNATPGHGGLASRKDHRGSGGIEKQVIFDMDEVRGGSSGSSSRSTSPVLEPDLKSGTEEEEEIDEDIPPFHLDMDDDAISVPPPRSHSRPADPAGLVADGSPLDDVTTGSNHAEHRKRKWKRWKKNKSGLVRPPPVAPVLSDEQREKSRVKAAKSAAKREQRRLELYKGDGMNPSWAERLGGHIPLSVAPEQDHAGVPPFPVNTPHLPTRPSSLRLATPAADSPNSASSRPSSSSSTPTSPTGASDHFVADLLHIPLDNLSLSFAEVETVTSPSVLMNPFGPASNRPSWSRSSLADSDDDEDDQSDADADQQTEYATSPQRELPRRDVSPHQARGADTAWPQSDAEPAITGIELICVEALVVRKNAEGVAGYKDWCEDGDDAWGFGEEDGDGEELGEVDPDDTWGFE